MKRLICLSWLLLLCGPLFLQSQNWQSVYTSTAFSNLNDLEFVTPLKGIAVGQRGLVVFTQDAGESWNVINAFTNQELYDLTFASPDTVFVCGKNGAPI